MSPSAYRWSGYFSRMVRAYYMDTTMSIIPLSSNYIYYSTVVTNVPELKNDSMGWALRKDIISMVRTIHADSFWSAQISHIIVDSAGMYELTPILGDHRILFGDANGVKEKLSNLFAFYKNVLNRIGWDKYQVLDVRFNGQVVASPSLPYSGPVDKAATNMNWVNSIVETEAKNDAKDSLKTKDIKVEQVTQNKKGAPVTQPVKATEKKPATTAQNKKNLPVKPPAKADVKKVDASS
jgi:cell division protein FtsQ